MNHIFCWLSSVPFSRFVLFSCKNNEAKGTCFLLGTLQSTLPADNTCVRLRVLPEGPQTPAELSHPLSSRLPAPWWVVANGVHCLSSADKHWMFEGTFQPSAPSYTLYIIFLFLFGQMIQRLPWKSVHTVSGSYYEMGCVSSFHEVRFPGTLTVILLKTLFPGNIKGT